MPTIVLLILLAPPQHSLILTVGKVGIGAMHHYGHSMRNGAAEIYGQVEDCLKEAELIVYWASDPEVTNGVYGSFEELHDAFGPRNLE